MAAVLAVSPDGHQRILMAKEFGAKESEAKKSYL
jgi:hypothetical protein